MKNRIPVITLFEYKTLFQHYDMVLVTKKNFLVKRTVLTFEVYLIIHSEPKEFNKLFAS